MAKGPSACSWSALQLTFLSHSCSLPLSDEIIKRSSCFIISCLFCTSHLVQSVSWHSTILYGKYSAVLGRNALLCCFRYNWSLESFKSRSVPLSYPELFVLNNSVRIKMTLSWIQPFHHWRLCCWGKVMFICLHFLIYLMHN